MDSMETYAGVAVNKRYKDSLFRMLFRERENLLSLYNAVNGTAYSDVNDLAVVTLENAVYMSMKNDQAFLLDCGLNLYEHQSSLNPNMPLRNLFYVSIEYQKLIEKRSLYSGRLIKIPNPNFVVFYNGTEKAEELVKLRLSDAYEKRSEDPNLELIVTQLNINPGYNEQIKNTCQTLREYMQYVERVRLYAADLPLEEAVNRAVAECIREGILAEFLSRNRAEAVMISILEYDEERERKLLQEEERLYREELRQEERRAGRAEGRSEARAGYRGLLKCMREDGRSNEIQRLETDVEFEKEMMEYYHLM